MKNTEEDNRGIVDVEHQSKTSHTVKHLLYFRRILIYHFASILLVFTRTLMGKLSFHRYLILWFYRTGKNLTHTKNVFYSYEVIEVGMYLDIWEDFLLTYCNVKDANN